VILSHFERDVPEAERLALDVMELFTRHNFAFWLAIGSILRGWARSASGKTAEGISCIENGIHDYRSAGSVLGMPHFLALKAEALYLAYRTSEAMEGVSPTKVRKVPQDSCQLPGRKGFSAIPELPRRDLV
jgi:hypothetical protein